jgi:hypothetical protein
LARGISYKGEKNPNTKITDFVKVVGIINPIFMLSLPDRKGTQEIPARATQPCRSETWTVTRNDERTAGTTKETSKL